MFADRTHARDRAMSGMSVDSQRWVGIGNAQLKDALHQALNRAGLAMRWIGIEKSGAYLVVVNVGPDAANPDDNRSTDELAACVGTAAEHFRNANPGQEIEVATRREYLPPEVR